MTSVWQWCMACGWITCMCKVTGSGPRRNFSSAVAKVCVAADVYKNRHHLMHVVREVCFCLRASLRWWHWWSGRRGFSTTAEDQEWCFLHAGSEEVKDTHCQRPATLARTQVLNQRTLLQPQGTKNRTHIRAHALMHPVVDKSPGAAGQKFPVRVCLFCWVSQ